MANTLISLSPIRPHRTPGPGHAKIPARTTTAKERWAPVRSRADGVLIGGGLRAELFGRPIACSWPAGRRERAGRTVEVRPLFPGIAAVALGRWRRVVVDVVGEPEHEPEDQEGACKAARDAIAAGGEVMLYDGQPPQWMVFGIAATRLKRSLKIGLTTRP